MWQDILFINILSLKKTNRKCEILSLHNMVTTIKSICKMYFQKLKRNFINEIPPNKEWLKNFNGFTMLSCIGTALKLRTIQLLYLPGHIILLSTQIMRVYKNCVQLNTTGLQTHSRKLTEYFGHSRKVSKRQPEIVSNCTANVQLFWRDVSYKAMCKRYDTHGNSPLCCATTANPSHVL